MVGPKGRRRRRSADQLREDLIAAGEALLLEEGVSDGLADVTIERAATRCDAPRASAYRLWSDEASQDDGPSLSPQATFQRAIALHILREGAVNSVRATRESTYDAVYAVIPPNYGELPEIRRVQVLRAVIREGFSANVRTIRQDQSWNIEIALIGSARSQPAGIDNEIRNALLDAAERSSKAFIPLYSEMASFFGFRLRQGRRSKPIYVIDQFASLMAALAEACALRETYDHNLQLVQRPVTTAKSEPWAIGAVAVEALVRQFFEPDPIRSDGVPRFWTHFEADE